MTRKSGKWKDGFKSLEKPKKSIEDGVQCGVCFRVATDEANIQNTQFPLCSWHAFEWNEKGAVSFHGKHAPRIKLYFFKKA